MNKKKPSTKIRKPTTKKSSTKKKTIVKKKVTTKKKTTNIKKKTTPKKTTTVKKKSTNIKKNTTPTKRINDKNKVLETNIEKNKKKKRFKLNKKIIYRTIYILIIITIALLFIYYLFFYISPTPIIKNVYIDENNNMVIKFYINKNRIRNKIWCIYKEDKNKPTISDKDWVLTKNNECSYPISKGKYYTYLKNQDNDIIEVKATSKTGKLTNIKTNKNIYLASNDTYKIELSYDYVGYLDETKEYIVKDKNILEIKDNVIKPLKNGKTTVNLKIMNDIIEYNVTVTSLITKRPTSFDLNKKNLKCKIYSKTDNDLIDEILKNKIENVGYKTRAGVVEAARFLTLDFPYRITYFYENGRQTTNNVDGEGRYYHKGLYLHNSRYSSITGSKKGPQIWGCSLYSVPDKKTDINGLDCSGFVSWALLNGGFDVKDVGAGWSNNLDLTDYGKVNKVTTSLINSNKIKVGDLLHSNRLGGHIGIIVGLDKNNYYVAQAIWYNPVGVVITKINKNKLKNDFPHVVLMDSYYKKDGKLTNMW